MRLLPNGILQSPSYHGIFQGYFQDILTATSYRAKNARVVTNLLTSCNNLLQQADIRMRSHGLRQLVDNKSFASCQQTCGKLIISTGLLQLVLQMTSCNKPDFNRLVAT